MINSTTSKQVFPEAQLKIFYSGESKPKAQGKILRKDGKYIYLADMDQDKWIINGKGYAIADQILEAFKKKDITILYRRKDLKTIYKATRQLFLKKGWKVNWGGHEQWILPVERFGYAEYFDHEPTDFPSMTVREWLKPPVKTLHIDPEQKLNSMFKLKEIWEAKYK